MQTKLNFLYDLIMRHAELGELDRFSETNIKSIINQSYDINKFKTTKTKSSEYREDFTILTLLNGPKELTKPFFASKNWRLWVHAILDRNPIGNFYEDGGFQSWTADSMGWDNGMYGEDNFELIMCVLEYKKLTMKDYLSTKTNGKDLCKYFGL